MSTTKIMPYKFKKNISKNIKSKNKQKLLLMFIEKIPKFRIFDL